MAKKSPTRKASTSKSPAKRGGGSAAGAKKPPAKKADYSHKAKAPKAPAKPAPAPKPQKAEPKAKGAPKPAPAAKGKAPPAPGAAKPGDKPVPAEKAAPGGAPAPKGGPAKASGRKGITIVAPKPARKPKAKSPMGAVPALTGSILGMGLGTGRPLIPSGPGATNMSRSAQADGPASSRKPKSPFNKRQLDKYRETLIQKRRELLGDINSMETEALQSQSGSLSHLPQHMAEQGSETYEQSLSLDLAAADRVLLREIDAALVRIEERTYGLCEHTGKPISKERLAELPWARYSIEAAREIERRTK